MNEQASDWAVGILMSTLGLVGLILASGARDDEMTVFGFALVGFAVLFVGGLIRRHYDERDAARAAKAAGHE